MSLKTFTSVFAFFFIGTFVSVGQSAGDTIRVQGFQFSSASRDTTLNFPDMPGTTFEKVLLKYTMRCKDALVSTGTNRNLGCGEWDYSCNTYLVDSSKIETVPSSVTSHFITNFSGTVFPYKATPVYDFFRGIQKEVTVASTANETIAAVGDGTEALVNVLATDSQGGKSQFIYSAAELTAAGLTAGEIDGISLNVLAESGEADFLKIRLKHTTESEFTSGVNLEDFEEVYYKNTTLEANQSNRFQFATPFSWDGTSNIIVEFSFSNINGNSSNPTSIEGETSTLSTGISSQNARHIFLTNNAYIEANGYKGVTGDQNRTVEAWIRTSAPINAEICSWGANVANQKWVFRITAGGNLRLENANGGTVSGPTVNDGKWHHVACVLDGNNLSDIRFLIDGELVPNSAVGNAPMNTTENFNVRISRGVNNRYLDAEVDELKIWDTNLSEQTISSWMRLKPSADHPNFSNLQLYYDFDEATGGGILDQSGNMRNASIIGDEFRVSSGSGVDFFKNFSLEKTRPNVDFYQGDYTLDISETTMDRPVEQTPHFVVERTIEPTDPTKAFDDNILQSATLYWSPTETIYDEATGAFILDNALTPDGEIEISDLNYSRRFPFYNELLSFVTPYGIGLDFGQEGKTWYFDMTDYVSILNGDKRLLMTLGGQRQEEMDLEFMFIVGTPPRDVIQYEQLWQATNRIGSARIADIVNDVKFAPQDISLSADASVFKLKSSITGHGAEGEFEANGGQVFHRILVDQGVKFFWTISQECSENPIFPQGGTWVYDRQGWCPGERSLLKEQDLTPLVTPGGTASIDYVTSSPTNAAGDYRYHVAHQVVGYGEANHQVDAAVIEIPAPNNSALYTRTGTVCSQPKVMIQNTGATTLTSLSIDYWVNDSMTPQNYVWNGSLEFMETAEVTLPSSRALWMDMQSDANVFHVSISKPNQGTDEYPHNNTYASNFDIPEVLPGNFTLDFRTNNRAFENNYQILDGSGNAVSSNNLPTNNTTFSDDFDLSGDCYKLVVNDAGGDGVQWWANAGQGTGSIRIKNSFGIVLKTFEPDFGGRFEYSFTTDFPLSAEELAFLTSIEVFPNPVSNILTVAGESLGETDFFLSDFLGKRMNPTILNSGNEEIQLDISALHSGIYFLTFVKGDIRTTRRIVKQ